MDTPGTKIFLEKGKTVDTPKHDFSDTVALMYSCLRYASAMWRKIGDVPPETIQATAACLFIEANRKGIKPTEKQMEMFRKDLVRKEE